METPAPPVGDVIRRTNVVLFESVGAGSSGLTAHDAGRCAPLRGYASDVRANCPHLSAPREVSASIREFLA